MQRIEKDALTLCCAVGYDLNTVEFAVEDGIPDAIDFMNPVPVAALYSVGEASFRWIVEAMATLAVTKAQSPPSIEIAPQSQTHCSTSLAGAQPRHPEQGPTVSPSPKDTSQTEEANFIDRVNSQKAPSPTHPKSSSFVKRYSPD